MFRKEIPTKLMVAIAAVGTLLLTMLVQGIEANRTEGQAMQAEGCWIEVWEHKNFEGRSVIFRGPAQDPKLGDNNWPRSDDEIGDDIDSLATGPNTWFEGFEDERFEDSVIKVGPNERIADLDKMEMGDDIDSFKLYDSKPSHW